MSLKKKVGRNDACPCGSGKKYKKCCLFFKNPYFNKMIAEVYNKMQENIIKENLREQRYGKIRPIIHTDVKGHKMVAVGKELHWSQAWKTFPDLLFYYIEYVLGKGWGSSEKAKPLEERHQILKWYDQVYRFRQRHEADKNGLCIAIPNGGFAAYLNLAYDLYVLRHHSALQEDIIRRLKHKDQFQGARYELFVAATCICAGFEIEYEDETDRKRKHPEFIAIHKLTGQKVSVEAKSRHRKGVLDFGGQTEQEPNIKTRIGGLLNEALRKPSQYPYVIFIDLNLPPYLGELFEKPWFNDIKNTITRMDENSKTSPAPFNLLLFTNHPSHYGRENEPDPAKDIVSIFPLYSQTPAKYPEVILDIHNAATQYGNIPNEFP